MLKFFKRKKKPRPDKPPRPETAELPADVLAIIEGLSIVARSSDEEGKPRTLIQVTGNSAIAWYHSGDESARMVEKLFPELNEQQISRAVYAINGKVKRTLAEHQHGIASNRAKWSASQWDSRKW